MLGPRQQLRGFGQFSKYGGSMRDIGVADVRISRHANSQIVVHSSNIDRADPAGGRTVEHGIEDVEKVRNGFVVNDSWRRRPVWRGNVTRVRRHSVAGRAVR